MEIFDTRERLLEAAAAEFLRHGFAGANVGKIAGAAGVSKKTVYVHFASKEVLFVAAAQDGLRKARLSEVLSVADDLSPSRVLRRFLREVLDLALSARGRASYRLVTSEAPGFAGLLHAYRASIEDAVIQPLAAWLQRKVDLGAFAIDDTRMAASMLIHMVLSEPLRDVALGGFPVPRPTIRTALVRQAVQLFVKGAALHGAAPMDQRL